MTSIAGGWNKIPLTILAINEGFDEYLEHVGEATLEQIDMGFDKGEDALGRPWEPLADPDGEILVDTGELRNSFEYEIDGDDRTVGIGSNADHAVYHEFGTGHVPARPILQPASIWAEEKLMAQGMEKVIGNRIDTVV